MRVIAFQQILWVFYWFLAEHGWFWFCFIAHRLTVDYNTLSLYYCMCSLSLKTTLALLVFQICCFGDTWNNRRGQGREMRYWECWRRTEDNGYCDVASCCCKHVVTCKVSLLMWVYLTMTDVDLSHSERPLHEAKWLIEVCNFIVPWQ